MDTLFLLFRLRLQFGILYSRVVNGHQSGDDNLLGQRDVAERDGAFREETIGNLSVDKPVYKLADALFGVFIQ